MTLKEIDKYFEAYKRRMKDNDKKQDWKIARICSVIANIKRDPRVKSTPFKEEDFIPQEKKVMSTDQFANMLKAITIGLGGDVK